MKLSSFVVGKTSCMAYISVSWINSKLCNIKVFIFEKITVLTLDSKLKTSKNPQIVVLWNVQFYMLWPLSLAFYFRAVHSRSFRTSAVLEINGVM